MDECIIMRVHADLSSSAPTRLQRRGLSLTELLGCIAAVTIGVGVGAYFLGVDLHVAAYRALEENDVIDQLPPELQDAIPVPASELEPELPPDEVDANLRGELDALRLEVARLSRLASEGETDVDDRSSLLATPDSAERGELTVVYWSRLHDISTEVSELLEVSQRLLNEQNVWQVLEVRRRAHHYAANAIEAINADGVDPQALVFADQVKAWYVRGGDLYQQAGDTWESQVGGTAGRAEELLAKGRRQLQEEALLLADQSQRVGELLDRRYGAKFEPISP